MSIGCLANLTHRKKRHVSMIDAIVRAAEAQAARPVTAWGCVGANGSIRYVDHDPSRTTDFCPHCKPLFRFPHRCMWTTTPEQARARYYRVIMGLIEREAKMVYKRTLGDILEDLKARQKSHPYQPQGGKLAEHRATWKSGVQVEYFVENGMARLNIVAAGRDVTIEELNQVKSAARVIFRANATERKRKEIGDNPEKRSDDKNILRLEWNEADTVKQAALELV